MNVADILKAKGTAVASIEPDKSVHEAVLLLVEKRIGSLLVIDRAGKLVGIITERDILRESARKFEKLRETRISEVMTRNLIVGRMDDDLRLVQDIMSEKRIRHLPILTDGKIEGIISIGDAVKALHKLTKEEADYLNMELAKHYVVE